MLSDIAVEDSRTAFGGCNQNSLEAERVGATPPGHDPEPVSSTFPRSNLFPEASASYFPLITYRASKWAFSKQFPLRNVSLRSQHTHLMSLHKSSKWYSSHCGHTAVHGLSELRVKYRLVR